MDEEPVANMKEDKQHLSHGSWDIGKSIWVFSLERQNAQSVLATLPVQIQQCNF